MDKTHIIKLTYESLIALLQGKEFHLHTLEQHFIFRPPFDGIFLTHDQISEIRSRAEMDVLNMVEKLKKHEESNG